MRACVTAVPRVGAATVVVGGSAQPQRYAVTSETPDGANVKSAVAPTPP